PTATGAQPPPDTAPQPSTKPAEGSQPVTETPAAGSSELPAGSFWQVMAVRQTDADSVRQSLKDKGFPVVLTPSPNGLTRVLVGPYADNQTFGRAKTDLENAGMHPVRFRP